MTTSLAIVGAYLAGSIPFAFLVGRWRGVDPRWAGTGNVGAGNVARLTGWWPGLLAAAGDLLKGFVPLATARSAGVSSAVLVMTAMAVVAGHNWPVFLRFQGGRGLAPSAGILLALDPGLLVWPATWGAVGWLIGGGLAGFIGWASLPALAVWLERPAPMAQVALGLLGLVVLRRVAAGSGGATDLRSTIRRAVFDTDGMGARRSLRS